jgi:hypothetical protein
LAGKIQTTFWWGNYPLCGPHLGHISSFQGVAMVTFTSNPELAGNPQGLPLIQKRSEFFLYAGLVVATILVMAVVSLIDNRSTPINQSFETMQAENISINELYGSRNITNPENSQQIRNLLEPSF